MTDYTKATGSSGTMMIRDTGTYVEFWLKAGSSTFAYDLPWGYKVNGVTDTSNTFRFESGGSYQRLGRWNVTTDQTVTFYLYDSGTSGLGGPTTFSVAIDRTSAPGTPGAWVIEQIFDTSVQGDTDTMPNGGIAIDQVQVRYDDNTSASSPSYFDPGTDAYGTITGLARGKTYYFWVRTHNSKGWSPWSARTQATTHNFPPAPSTPVPSVPTQTTATVKFSSNGDGGSAVLEWQLAVDTVNPPVAAITSSGTSNLTGLSAGMTYYFRARGRNKYGWGAWSAISSVELLAGAYVDYLVNGVAVKKKAVPYVKTGGVWKVAQPMVNLKGLWKATQ